MPRQLVLALMALLMSFAGAFAAVHVQSVLPGSAAEEAGVAAGDLLVRLAGREVATMDDLRSILAGHRPEEVVPLVVEREGEPVELTLTLGSTPAGGAALGVSLHVAGDGEGWDSAASRKATETCLSWIEETYRIPSRLERFGLDLVEDYEALKACVSRDTMRMDPEVAVTACDNVFKVHCSALDLLTEIGESIVESCEEALGDEISARPEGDKAWRRCAEREVFDRFVLKGQVSDAAACRAIWIEECGAEPPPSENQAAWRGWGGPGQEFRAPAGRLAESWPESGPERLWSRRLGEGYSGILYEEGRLYTMYRQAEDEVAVCLDASSGATVWESRHPRPLDARHVENYGLGPNSTPLLAGDRLFTVGMTGTLNALDKRTGEIVWSRELWGKELGGTFLQHGYSSSPMAHGNTVIVPVGGEQAGLVAFDQGSGRVVWMSPPMQNSYSSPRMMEILGEAQIVVMMSSEIIGLDPGTGGLLWSFPHENQWQTNVSLPLLAEADTIFLSSPQAGARGLRLSRDEGGWQAEEIWATRRIQLYHVSATREGDWVYGSSGTASPAFMSAMNMVTGEIGWRQRGFGKANTLAADGKLVILDEDGVLYLARPHPERLEVLARTQLLDRVSWTVPTLVGTILYARDRGVILAVDLG